MVSFYDLDHLFSSSLKLHCTHYNCVDGSVR